MPTEIMLTRSKDPDEQTFDQKLLERLQDILAGRNDHSLPTQISKGPSTTAYMIDSGNNFGLIRDTRTPQTYTLRARHGFPDSETRLTAAKTIICAEWPAIFGPSSPAQHFAHSAPVSTGPLDLWLPKDKDRKADIGGFLVSRLQDILVGQDKAHTISSLEQPQQALDIDARFDLFQDLKNPNHYTVAVRADDQSAKQILQAAQAIMKSEFPEYLKQPKQGPIRKLLAVLKLG